MEEDKNKFESIVQHFREYLEIKWKILVLDSSDKASSIASSLVSIILISAMMLFVILFLSIGAAFWIGDLYGSTSTGFLYVGLFYLVVSIILIVFKDALIKTPVSNKLLQALSRDEKD